MEQLLASNAECFFSSAGTYPKYRFLCFLRALILADFTRFHKVIEIFHVKISKIIDV
jgi:hypothetical protein